MSDLSPASYLEMLDIKENINQRFEATKQVIGTQRRTEILLSLSRDLRAYSERNRAFAQQVRIEAARQRAKAQRSAPLQS